MADCTAPIRAKGRIGSARGIGPTTAGSIAGHARPRARRRGPRAPLVAAAASFAEVFVEETTSARRSGWTTARSRSSPPGSIAAPASASPRARRTATRTRTGWTATRCSQAAEAASAALREGEAGAVVDLRTLDGPGHEPRSSVRPRRCRRPTRWRGCARSTMPRARSAPRSTQVVGVYGDSLQRRLIATSDGRWVEEDAPAHPPGRAGGRQARRQHPDRVPRAGRVRGRRVRRRAPADGRRPRSRRERAVTMLDSIPAPAGEMTVVLAPGMGGVLFHEAVGHPLEADAIDKEASVYRGPGRHNVRERADQRRRRRDDPERLGLVHVRRRGRRRRSARCCSPTACCRGSSTTGCAPTRTAWRSTGQRPPPVLRVAAGRRA